MKKNVKMVAKMGARKGARDQQNHIDDINLPYAV
jgi:hypothetical protein